MCRIVCRIVGAMVTTNFKRAPDDPSSDDSRPRWRVGTIRVYRQRSAGFASRAAGSGSATMSRSSITRTPLTRSGKARLTRIGRHGWPAQRVVPVSSGGRIRITDPGRRTPLRERARGHPYHESDRQIRPRYTLGARHMAPRGGRPPPVSSAISAASKPASASTRSLCCPRRGAGAASGSRSPS